MSDSVSRETSREVFGSGFAAADRYAQWLTGEGIVRGLLGPREAERVWDRHLLNSALIAPWIPQGARVGDIGSGAGLPGIPVGLARSDVSVTLVEPLLRRVRFLDEVVADLRSLLPNDGYAFEVVRSRAEDLIGQRSFDAVVARAVAPLERLVTWTVPLLSETGCLIAIKGSTASEEVTQAAPALAALKLTATVETTAHGDATTTVVVVRRHP